jgi:DNA-binding transcriptional LysR family regulator
MTRQQGQPPSLSDSRLKLRHFKLLVAIDKHRNILGAAESIGISQPGASKLLAEIEDVFGTRLFERRPRGLEPNEMGDLLIRRSHVFVSLLDKTGVELDSLRTGDSGSVKVGALGTRGLELTTSAANTLKMRGKTSMVQAFIDVGNTEYLVRQLEDGALDCLIGWVVPDLDPQSYAVEVIEHEKFNFICREHHPLLKEPRLTLRDLVDAEWVFQSPDSLVRRAAEALFIAQGLPAPVPNISSSSLLSMLVFLQDTDAISVSTETAVRRFSSAGGFRTLPIADAITSQVVGIVTPTEAEPKPAVRLFLEAVRIAAASPIRS